MISNCLSTLLAVACVPLAISGTRAAVEISSKPTQNMSCSAGVCTPTAKQAVLNVTDLANLLAGADTTVQSASVAQDIEIDAALSWTSTHRLTLDAYHSLAFNKPVTIAGTGALTITTNDGGRTATFASSAKAMSDFGTWTAA